MGRSCDSFGSMSGLGPINESEREDRWVGYTESASAGSSLLRRNYSQL